MEIPADIGSFVLPGTTTLTIIKGIEHVEQLTDDMRESDGLWEPVAARMHFLCTALPGARERIEVGEFPKLVVRFAEVIGLAIDLLKKYRVKQGLQRVAASRAVRKAVRLVHGKLDVVFIDAGLESTPEMNEWKQLEPGAVDEQRERLTDLIENRTALVNGLSESQLLEAVTEVQLEHKRRPNPSSFMTLLERALTVTVDHLGAEAPEVDTIPIWFVSRDEVEIGEEIDIGAFGAVHRATWGEARAVVCAKLLLVEGPDAQKQLLDETLVWSQLSHPNVLRMLGACHVGSPLFFISELVENGNLVDFLRDPANKCKLWRLFLDAAQGLSYLHDKSIVHGDLKCNNILVGNDGKALLCDFGFSHTRTLSIGKSVKVQTMAVRWKAPECVLKVGPEANPSFASDVYSLGMSIIEAKTGSVPWGVVSDDAVSKEIVSGNGYPRPANVFSDKEWRLVQGMTASKVADRMSLTQAIEQLRELAGEEELMHGEVVVPVAVKPECQSCGASNAMNSNFCNNCGARLSEPGVSKK